MDGTVVKAIEELALKTAEPLELSGQTYTATPMHDIRKADPAPKALEVSSLTSLVDYLVSVRPADNADVVALHVVDPVTVEAIGALHGHFQQRFVFVSAKSPDRMSGTGFQFGRFIGLEAMNVALQALFEPTEDRARTLAVVGNVRDEVVRGQSDDGVSQEVNARSGIVLVEKVKVPNPVTLKPRRTFLEVEQPASPFILRLKKADESGITAALFEADGGAWRATAMASIAEFLRERVPAFSVLA